jgi:tight adherence protein C
VLGVLVAPAFARLREALDRVLGGSGVVRLRLRQAASVDTAWDFRSRQLVWGIGGIGVGVVLAVVLSTRGASLLLQVAVVVVSCVTAVVLRDRLLRRQARARMMRMSEELPTVLEFLTLSLSAGEGIRDAIRRVALIGHGELAAEFSGVVTGVGTGLPLAPSLMALAEGVQLPALSRCVEHVVGALERGTPLAEVLRAQAQDARDEAKRSLLEVAGKKEVAMMVPLVFLILPTTIAFAIFPGLFVLQLGF